MRVDLFDFDLPPDRIALRPIVPRDAARMLVVDPPGVARFHDRTIRELPDFLRPGDALVVNDTRVIAAQLRGKRTRGGATARIAATLIKRIDESRWCALVRPARKLEVGERIRFGESSENTTCLLGALDAEVEAKGEAGDVTLRFALAGAALDEAIDRLGDMPLPPYIAAKRAAGAADRHDYQTVFASEPGAVAAPTAGLHFTSGLVERVLARGASLHRITLHVGPGTFLPVKADDTQAHKMHAEWGEIDAATAARLNAARKAGGRIVAVGTTSLRLLESAAAEDGTIAPFAGETSIFITPGYGFRAVDLLLTNFHLPRSTLFMLVAAFSGLQTMRAAYKHAIETGYRFYSYGDACLLVRAS
jgi:S-adenosylmethionine:tRNA ribosyltransferase-isomerase